MKKSIHILAFTIVMLLLTAGTTTYADSFSISQSKATMNIGEVIDLDVSGTEKDVKWLSYNENIVSVDDEGVITAHRTGKTTIRARVGFWYKTCSVNVVKPTIKVNKTSATIYNGGTSTNSVKLKATIKGATKDVSWTSSDESVAVVDENGNVKSVSDGMAVITASANGLEASSKITVKKTELALNIEEMQLSTKGAGSSIKITPTITGSNKKVKWSTSDKNIATVKNGKVTGKKEGTAVITATANGISKSCNVTVVSGLISINEENVVLYTGETKALKTNATKNDVCTWNTSDESVVSVTNGTIAAKKAGIAIVSIENNGKTDECIVTVKDTATTIFEDEVSLRTKGTDKTYTLNTTVVGRKSAVTWTSSNKSIASVSKGKITAKKSGTVTITATANGVSDNVVVTVSDFEPTITLNHNSYALYTSKGNTVTLKATVDGASKTVTYTSSNPDCATVTNKGKVTALKAGETLITATANGVSAQCLITVKETAVVLEKENLVMQKGDVENIGVDVIGKSQSVKWVTSNKKVVTVKNGKVTAIENGEADITVTANGVKSICHVVVSECTHSFDEGKNIYEPTCGESGICKYTCTMCGYSYKETVPALEHEYVETKREEPTCTTCGYVLYECKNCKDTKQEQLLSLDHIWDGGVITKEPTCEIEGEKTITCILCLHSYTEPVSIINHEYAELSKVEADCENNGVIVYKCKICELSYFETLLATGHNLSNWEIVKEATEEEEGLERQICLNCQKEETRVIEKIKHVHKYEEVVTAPTCEKKGYTTYTCRCGKTFISDYTTQTGHSYGEWVTTKEPTEDEEGTKESICSKCGDVIIGRIEKLEKHEHSYEDISVTEPTCTEQGYTTYECKCGYSFRADFVERLGHNYEDVIVKEATCTEEGEVHEICSLCKTKACSKPIDVLGHSYNEIENSISANNGYGYIVYECSRCEDVKTGYRIGFEEGPEMLYNGDTYQVKLLTEVDEKLLPYVKYIYECSYNTPGYIENFDHIMSVYENGTIRINIEDYSNIKDTVHLRIGLQIEENPYNAYIEKCDKFHSNIADYRENLAHQKIKNEVIPSIIKEDMNDAEKVLVVHDWICENVYYDYDTYYENENYDSDSYWYVGAILNGKAVCSGYSDLFYRFMQLLEIPCLGVLSNKLNHGWNQVMLEGEWYWLDATWDDAGNYSTYSYFLRRGERIDDQHLSDHTKPPECTGTKGLGLIFEKYYASTKEELINTLAEQSDEDKVFAVFHTEEEYNMYWIEDFLSMCSKEYGVKINSIATIKSCTVNDVYYDEYYIVSYKNTEEMKAVVEQEYNKQNNPDKNHIWGEWISVNEATETEEGLEKRICSVCSEEETRTIPIKEHEHVYESVITNPSCTEDGYTTHTCACGDYYTDTFVTALGHTWGEWETVKDATEAEEGSKKHICSVCYTEETEIIPIIDETHSCESDVTDPDCADE